MQDLNIKHQTIPISYILKSGREFSYKRVRGTEGFGTAKSFNSYSLRLNSRVSLNIIIMIDSK